MASNVGLAAGQRAIELLRTQNVTKAQFTKDFMELPAHQIMPKYGLSAYELKSLQPLWDLRKHASPINRKSSPRKPATQPPSLTLEDMIADRVLSRLIDRLVGALQAARP